MWIGKLKTFKNLHSDTRVLLICLCFLMMFSELFIIRWAGSNIVFLSLFSNLILLASFLGIGIGFLGVKRSRELFSFAPILLSLLVLLGFLFRFEYQITFNATGQDLTYENQLFKKNLVPLWVSIPIIFVLVTFLMMSIADGVARVFQRLPPLQAYRFDILGSLAAIILFSLLSFLHTAPLIWGLVIVILFAGIKNSFLRGNKNRSMAIVQVVSLSIMLLVLYQESNGMYAWSSYYKINTVSYLDNRYAVNVNGLPQQFIESVAQRRIYKPFYFSPYRDRNTQLP